MNKFKKYFSYFYRFTIEKTASKYNSSLIVAIQNGKYVLNTKNANYSFASLHRVFQQALQKIEIKDTDAVLILGCGAGSIPTIIYNELHMNPSIDAIEIDEKVIELGNKYFGLSNYPNLTIIVDDAINFVKNTNKKYDYILIDLFEGIKVPGIFLTQSFFENLKVIMNRNGEVLLNFVAYNYEAKQEVTSIEKRLKNTFNQFISTYQFEGINRIFHAKQ